MVSLSLIFFSHYWGFQNEKSIFNLKKNPCFSFKWNKSRNSIQSLMRGNVERRSQSADILTGFPWKLIVHLILRPSTQRRISFPSNRHQYLEPEIGHKTRAPPPHQVHVPPFFAQKFTLLSFKVWSSSFRQNDMDRSNKRPQLCASGRRSFFWPKNEIN